VLVTAVLLGALMLMLVAPSSPSAFTGHHVLVPSLLFFVAAFFAIFIALGLGATGLGSHILGDDLVGTRRPVTQDWARSARIDDLLDAEALGGPER
jgi:hypothetical protein